MRNITLFYPPSPNTPSVGGDEGAFSSGFGGFRPQHSAKDGFLRSSPQASEGESRGTPRLRGGLHLRLIMRLTPRNLQDKRIGGIGRIL
ncbi:MAG: hypothetical protein A3C47_04485 [Omnitrophica bacterium RIFCSPHIGHO2_02_FULL_51_18]|nr:MAG: hypothetical protein A3C47_04485 [Omnitrophica bacterium RIFCSPHIGHO2_02_FULL_51_18]